MKLHSLFFILAGSIMLFSCNDMPSKKGDSDSSNAKLDPDLMALIDSMSIEEKVGQMTQINLDLISVGEVFNLKEPHELAPEKLKKAIHEYHVGSFLNVGGHAYSLEHWRSIITDIQTEALSSRLQIPIVYGIDAIHGANYLVEGTLFPQPLAQAATFNPDLVEQIAAATAYETKASGITWNFSPVLDVARQPLWSRVFETYGEDVMLASEMGKAAFRGYQGDNPADPEKLGGCMKHFLGYSAPWTGRDRTPVYLADIQLREYYLPTFEAAIKENALSVMINSGELNGIPVHADKSILTDLLRDELGFDGVAVSDWEDIIKLHRFHKVAPSLKEAVAMSINAGLDMSMVPNDYEFCDLLIELVQEGRISEDRLNESVYRILKMKKRMGLFETPLPFEKHKYPNVASVDHINLAYNTAAEAITLLKNEGNVLPIKTSTSLTLIGKGANSLIHLNGSWSRTWQGIETEWDDDSKLTIKEAIDSVFKNTTYLNDSIDLPALMQQLRNQEEVIVVMSEDPSTEKPGDINNLNYEQEQIELVKNIANLGYKPIVLLIQNRPRIISEIEGLAKAIVLCYQPSDNGAMAIADMLSGVICPSGRLPITYPRYTNALLTYDHKTTERLDIDFSMNAFQPQYEFGHGLSYADFEYSNLTLSDSSLSKGEKLEVTVTVTNQSDIMADHSVLLFVTDEYASITPSVKRLKAFDKQRFNPRESKTITFSLEPHELAFVNAAGKWIAEAGQFSLHIEELSSSFELLEDVYK